jgi:hypothetical protein
VNLPARHPLHAPRERIYAACDDAAESVPPRPADEPIEWLCDSAEMLRAMVVALAWDRGARPEVQRKAAAGMEHWVAGGEIRGVTLVLCSPMVKTP